MTDDNSEATLDRRTFVKATGAAAGAGLLGAGAGTAGAAHRIDSRFLNWRTVEAQKVWDRGYRGRPDRTLALTDSGLAARHPDLGPWNGVLADTVDGEFKLTRDVETEPTQPDAPEPTVTDVGSFGGTGTLGPGGPKQAAPGAPDASAQAIVGPFVPNEEANNDATVDRIDASATWTPPRQDNDFFLQVRTDGEWQNVGSSISFNPQSGGGESFTVDVDGSKKHRFVLRTFVNAACQYDVSSTLQSVEQPESTEPPEEDTRDYSDPDEIDPFAQVPDDPTAVDSSTPKTVGWYDAGSRYGTYNKPRDPDGHGSHVSGIMAASGRASTIDPSNTEVYEPRAVLLPGDFVEYDVEVPASGTVFASAFGESVKVEIVHDDEVVHTSPMRFDSIVADEPAVHDSGTASYTVRVRPARTQDASAQGQDAPMDPESGTPLVGRLNEIAVGTYTAPAGTAGDRTADGAQSVHSGMAPNQSLVGLQGLSGPTADLASFADEFAATFNTRAVNMSWGFAYGAPVGGAGGLASNIPSQIRDIAKGGILTVASAGNAITPANGNGSAAGTDEAISVAATDPFDGLASYSSGGLATVDEDESDPNEDGVPVDRKPDVTAPGGDLKPDVVTLLGGVSVPTPSVYELSRSVGAPGPDESFATGDPPRDFLSIGGTSMSSPYTCGAAGLVAQAMEEDAPLSISLPEPADTGFEDVMRLKQVILATASETPFTAAPYHNAKTTPHQPSYEFGGRDPYEGFGRINPDAAVDAVTRPLVADDDEAAVDTASVEPTKTESATLEESVGVYIPEDSRAVAGYVDIDGGSVSVDIAHQRYSGGNTGMAKGAPHIDLFVYDGVNPAENGEPNIVTRAQGRQGSASVSVSGEGTYYVVAKLVNVPGAVNGFDVTSQFDLSVSYTAPAVPAFSASGTRTDDGSVFTGGQPNQVFVEPTGLSEEVPDDATVEIFGQTPWETTGFGDADAGVTGTVDLGTATAGEIRDGSVSRTYFAEAPSDPAATGPYTFGPATLKLQSSVDGVDGTEATFGGTDNNVVVGSSTNI
jgi:hypothetical protein